MDMRAVLSGLAAFFLSAQIACAQTPAPAVDGAWRPAVSKTAEAKPKAAESPAKTAGSGTSKTAKPAIADKTAPATPAAPSPPAAAAAAAPAATAPATTAPAAAPLAASAAGAPITTGTVPPAAAAAAPAPVKSGDWMLECGGETPQPVCTLRQLVADSQKRRIVEMRAMSVRNTAFLEVIVPVGISIPYGVTVDVAEGKKLAAQLVDCGQTGCRAVLPLNAENLTALKTAKTLAVTFQDSKSGKVISISGSPKGFDLAIAKVVGAG